MVSTNTANAAEPKRHIKKLFVTDDGQTDETAFQYSRLWVKNVVKKKKGSCREITEGFKIGKTQAANIVKVKGRIWKLSGYRFPAYKTPES